MRRILDVQAGDVLSVSVFGKLEAGEETEAFRAIQKAKRKELRSGMGTFVGRVLAWESVGALRDALRIELTKVNFDSKGISQKLEASLKTIECQRAEWRCGGEAACGGDTTPVDHPAKEPVCDELKETLEVVQEMKGPPLDRSALTVGYEALSDILGDERPADNEAYCKNYAVHTWLEDEKAIRLLSRSMIPDAEADDLLEAQYDLGADRMTLWSKSRPVLLLQGVPHDATPRLHLNRSKGEVADPAVYLGTWLTYVFQEAIGHEVKALIPGARSAPEEERGGGRIVLLHCGEEPEVDPGLQPVAPVGSRAYSLREALGSQVITARVCAGEECVDEGEEANVTNVLELVSEPRHGPIVLAGFGLTLWRESIPTWEKVGGSTRPDQIFEVREGGRRDLLPSIDLLLGWRYKDFVAALGPGVLNSEVSAFKHWKAGVGWRYASFSRHIYLLLHLNLTLEPASTDFELGERIVLPEGTKPQMEGTQPRFGGGLTIAIDASVLGEISGSLFGSGE